MMRCDDCKEQPAAIHVTQIINGQKTELNLCFPCASRRNIQVLPLPFPVQFPFKPAIPATPSSGYGLEERACGACGYSWREFMATGFLGCTRCYEFFADLLGQLITRNQGNVRHQGKFPLRGQAPLRIRREIALLRNELEQAVQQENFERAAELRDEIRRLEQEVS